MSGPDIGVKPYELSALAVEIVLICAVYDFNWRIANSSKETAVVQDLCHVAT